MIPLVPGWERVVNSWRLDPAYDIYLTGSNARLLRSELATLLTGRYVAVDAFPLSFAEFWSADPQAGTLTRRQGFEAYLRAGGWSRTRLTTT